MNTKILTLVCVSMIFISCNSDSKTDNAKEGNSKVSITFNQLLDDYYEDGVDEQHFSYYLN